jgi:O-antigen ligase
MLGLGLGEFVPYVIYVASFIVAFVALFYRAEIGVLFLTSLFPIYSILSKAQKTEIPLANNITDIIIVAMLLGWAFRHHITQNDEYLSPPPVLKPLFVLIIYLSFSWFIGTNNFGDMGSEINIARLSHLKNYLIMPLLYLIAYYNLRDVRLKYILLGLLAASFLLSDMRFQQTFKWVKRAHYMEKSRLGGTLGALGPNEMGAFHTIYTLFFMGIFLVDRHVWRRILYALLIAGGMYCLIYSFSRGAYAGILIGIFFIALVRARWVLVPLTIFIFSWKAFVPQAVVERIENSIVEDGARSDVVAVGGVELETAGRTEIWATAMDYFFENPLFGKGYNTYELLTGWDTHNVYIKFLAEQGVVGLFLFLLLYFLAYRSGWKLYQNTDDTFRKALGFGFVCAVVGSIVTNVFGDRWTYLQLGGIYWVIWALVDQENSLMEAKSETEGLPVGHQLRPYREAGERNG